MRAALFRPKAEWQPFGIGQSQKPLIEDLQTIRVTSRRYLGRSPRTITSSYRSHPASTSAGLILGLTGCRMLAKQLILLWLPEQDSNLRPFD
jgi:hypothetical protein